VSSDTVKQTTYLLPSEDKRNESLRLLRAQFGKWQGSRIRPADHEAVEPLQSRIVAAPRAKQFVFPGEVHVDLVLGDILQFSLVSNDMAKPR
jgi:hypothetical protein